MSILDSLGKPYRKDCDHAGSMPAFDKAEAAGMSAGEIREHFPRFMGNCIDCGAQVILYACVEQYIGGDY